MAVSEPNTAALIAVATRMRRNMGRLRLDGASIQKKTSSCRKSARTLWGPAGRGESPCAAGRPYLLVALVSRRLRRSNSLLVQVEAHLLASEENAGHRLCAVAFRLGGVAGASGSSLG